jgi:hypothetical protein
MAGKKLTLLSIPRKSESLVLYHTNLTWSFIGRFDILVEALTFKMEALKYFSTLIQVGLFTNHLSILRPFQS